MKEFIYLEDEAIKEHIKMLLVYTNLLYKNHLKSKNLGIRDTPNNKGIISLLAIYGDTDKIIQKNEVEAEYRFITGQVSTLEDFVHIDEHLQHVMTLTKQNKN